MPHSDDPLSLLDEISEHKAQGASLLAIEMLLIGFCLAAYALT